MTFPGFRRDKNDSSDFHQRILLKALVNTPFGPVNIMNTHLSLSKAARYSFCRNYIRLLKYLMTYCETWWMSMFFVSTAASVILILNSCIILRFGCIRTRTILEIGRYSLSLKPSRAVLVGDFNEDEMSFIENLQGKFGFEDVWTKLKPSQQNQKLSFTFNSW